MTLKDGWRIFTKAIGNFFAGEAMVRGAAMAYYTALSLAPLLILFVWATSYLGDSMQKELQLQLNNLIGNQGAQTFDMIIESAQKSPDVGTISGIIGLVVLLFGATGVFAELQAALNSIWNIKIKPNKQIWTWIRKRLLSLGLILVFGFLLLVSLALSAVVAFVSKSLIVVDNAAALLILDLLVSIGITACLFAALFKFLPDVQISWRVVWFGAITTAILFGLGKWLIGLYIGRSSFASAYGAAGSLIVLLVWTYYSALILFFGAELTQSWAHHFREPIEPDEYAELDQRAEAQQYPAPAVNV